MKKAVIGVGMMISGTIGISTQRIIDTIFVANNWNLNHGGVNILLGISGIAVVGGVILCILALKDS